MADGTISIADWLGLQALDRHYQRSHLTAKPQSISTSSKPENSSRLDLGADDSTTMLEGLGGKAVDSNEMRRKQRNPVDSAPTHGPHVVSTSSRSSPTMTLHKPFDLCPANCYQATQQLLHLGTEQLDFCTWGLSSCHCTLHIALLYLLTAGMEEWHHLNFTVPKLQLQNGTI
ncbi:hypothetical protein RHGRI_010966 [Rhododendron griersonianum]|uniref:Uncharacterized protein n=1 Tax=Rhododendron griersonianum TaxID=479676 RepID=A0AAV6KK84_9ERIC|nr:hypothetical protein RHGRI_010966 [Rhododendron griersonianum]